VKRPLDRNVFRNLIAEGAVLKGLELGSPSDRFYVLKAERTTGVDVTLIRSKSFDQYAAVVSEWMTEKQASHA
jgi:hypothetical protein